jgi:gp16 family phage-associated protein
MTRSPQEVIEDFRKRGVSIATWARQNGVSQALVYQVLRGNHVPCRGQSHKIAVLLGIKNGVLDTE